MAKISVVINTLNEEINLSHAINSVRNFADEVVVVDMYSIDKTVDIAKKSGAKVFMHQKTNYVEPARNFAISKASGHWILVLDADERLSSTLESKLKKIVSDNSCDFVRIPRKNMVFGKWLKHSRWWPDYNIRFFKKGKVSWSEVIHSVPMTQGIGVDLLAKEKYAIVHHHYRSVDQYILRMNRYSSVQAEKLFKEGYASSWQDMLTKPGGEFFSRFFFGKGYKDGIHGLALSLLQAFSELIVYLKVWQMSKFPDEKLELTKVNSQLSKITKDLNYWKADAYFQERKSPVAMLRRKLRI